MVQLGHHLSATCSMICAVVPVNCPSTVCMYVQTSRPPHAPTPLWKAVSCAADAIVLFGISFDGRCESLIGVALALGAAVGVAVPLVGAAVGVEVGAGVGVEVAMTVGVGVSETLATVTTTDAAPTTLLDESKPLIDSV